jgi:hypothetical protein
MTTTAILVPVGLARAGPTDLTDEIDGGVEIAHPDVEV